MITAEGQSRTNSGNVPHSKSDEAPETFWLQGLELVPQLQSGDVIVSSRIVDGGEHLVRP